jgi:phage terminase large subunit-like protein
MVEDVGKSDDFIQVVTRNPNLRINPKPPGRLKKEKRLEQTLGPWLENGAIRISDAETPFLTELRNELDNYPLHSHDDAMDALYYAMRNMPEVLTLPINEEIPIIGSRNNKLNNPYAHIGEW